MKSFFPIVVTIVLFLTTVWMAPAHADQFSDTIAIYKKSPAVQPFFKNNYGYVVFPTVGKAGFVVARCMPRGK